MIIVTELNKDVKPKLYTPLRGEKGEVIGEIVEVIEKEDKYLVHTKILNDEMIEKVLEGKKISYTVGIKKQKNYN